LQKNKKAFTLVELLAAMAIIAILIGLAGFGISTALRASRNSQREKMVDNLQVAIQDYLGRQQAYPTSITLANGFLVLNPAPSGDPIQVPVKGVTVPKASTDSQGTQYCYSNAIVGADGYILGAKLEGGSWYDLGTATTDSCATDSAPGNTIQ